MTETERDGVMPADPADPLSVVAFSRPAVLADRVLVSERGGVVRIAVAETALDGSLHFRGAVAVSLSFAAELADILGELVKNARARDGGE